MKIRKTLGAIVALVSLAAPAYGGGSVELRADKENTVLDVKMSGSITGKFDYFVRHLQTADYRGATSGFTLLDLSYEINNNLGLVIDNQFSEAGVRTKYGVGATTSIKSVGLGLGVLVDGGKNPKRHELSIFADYERDKLRANSEIYSNLGYDGKINSINGRLNLGIKIMKNIVAGIFSQGILTRQNKTLDSKLGVFLKVNN